MKTSLLVLLISLNLVPAVVADPCREDLSAPSLSLDAEKLEGEHLRSAVESLAHFELNQVQDCSKPSSAVAGLKDSLRDKISLIAVRASLSEEAIRSQILAAKQRLLFGSGRTGARDVRGEELERERAVILENQSSRYFEERILPTRANAIALSPDGKHLMVGGIVPFSPRKYVEFWNLETSEPPIHNEIADWPSALAFSPDGTLAVSAGKGAISLWDGRTGKRRKQISYDGVGTFVAISLTGDNRRMAGWVMGTSVSDILVWDVGSGRKLDGFVAFPGGHYPPEAISLEMDSAGRWILAVSGSDTAKLWTPQKGPKFWDRFRRAKFKERCAWPATSAATVIPGGDEILRGSKGGVVLLSDFFGSWVSRVGFHTEKVLGIKTTADGKRAVSVGAGGDLLIWDLQRMGSVQELRFPVLHGIRSTSFLNVGGDRIACIAKEGEVRIWNYRKTLPSELDIALELNE